MDVKLIGKVIDTFTWFIPKKKEISLNDVKTILVIDCGVMGDTIMSLPAIHGLRKRFPNKKIKILINPKFKELWKGNEDYDELIEYDCPWLRYGKYKLKDVVEWFRLLKKIKCDLLIELRGDVRNLLFLGLFSKARIKIGHTYSGGKNLLTRWIEYPEKNEVYNQIEVVKLVGCRDFDFEYPIIKKIDVPENHVLLFPTPGYESKAWIDDKWVELADNFDKVMFVCVKGDKHVENIRNKMKKESIELNVSLEELPYVIKKARLIIGVDTGPMHLASAIGKRTVSLFGITDEKRWSPYRNNKVIKKEKMEDITVEEVLKLV